VIAREARASLCLGELPASAVARGSAACPHTTHTTQAGGKVQRIAMTSPAAMQNAVPVICDLASEKPNILMGMHLPRAA
jgi:hypothetical protein